MYLPLTGHDPDRDRQQKMKITSPPPVSPQTVVQPASAAPQAFQRPEGVGNENTNSSNPALEGDTPTTEVESQHYAATCYSTQDFLALRTQASDDQFAELDKLIARMKDKVEAAGDFVEAIKKMKEMTDPDSIALQVLTKTLEGLEESQAKE